MPLQPQTDGRQMLQKLTTADAKTQMAVPAFPNTAAGKDLMMIYKTRGTCSSRIELDLGPDHVIQNVSFTGGCNGNLQGISKLVTGRRAEDVIESLEGIRCGFRNTSCPDQLAKALKTALAES